MDEKELETLKERAEFFGLDKTKDFNEFKEKYLNASEKEQSKPKYLDKDTVINRKVIESSDYRKRFNQVSDRTDVNRKAWQLAKEMLNHRSGTRYEDIAFIDYLSGKAKINKKYNKESTAKPSKSMKKMLQVAELNTIIAIHNHPGSSVPSIPDLRACIQRGYKKGIIVCHNGKVYIYSVNADKYIEPIAASVLDLLEKRGYTEEGVRRLKDAGISLEVL